MRPTTLIIADDHGLIRIGLKHILEEQPGWKVIAEASDGLEAVSKTREHQPNVTVMDLEMPILNGLEACRQIAASAPRTKVLILTMHDEDSMVGQALEAGARGYLLKSDVSHDLVTAVTAIHSNRTYFTTKVNRMLLAGHLKPNSKTDRPDKDTSYTRLTVRQREIVQLLADGKSNKEISAILNLGVKTTETHRANIMRRLDCHSVSELVRFAVRNQLIEA